MKSATSSTTSSLACRKGASSFIIDLSSFFSCPSHREPAAYEEMFTSSAPTFIKSAKSLSFSSLIRLLSQSCYSKLRCKRAEITCCNLAFSIFPCFAHILLVVCSGHAPLAAESVSHRSQPASALERSLLLSSIGNCQFLVLCCI